CDRYGISNAHRTLHGALLDSELLAEVWLAMTRGQNSLGIDISDDSGPTLDIGAEESADAFQLPVLYASAEETAVHQAYLDKLDKDAKGNGSVWRRLESSANSAL